MVPYKLLEMIQSQLPFWSTDAHCMVLEHVSHLISNNIGQLLNNLTKSSISYYV